jgi:hypothetical protein
VLELTKSSTRDSLGQTDRLFSSSPLLRGNLSSPLLTRKKKLESDDDFSMKDVEPTVKLKLLIFLRNSRKFCGVARMASPMDWNNTDDHWQENSWRGCVCSEQSSS